MLREAGLDRAAIAGSRTALLFVTAAAYGASNVEFIAGRAGTLHFPYTAPSALSAEVAIEFGLTGAYVILIGGAAATVDALWQASRLLQDGRCDRALVLAVETFDECEDLWRRARWALAGAPGGSRGVRAPGARPRAVRSPKASEPTRAGGRGADGGRAARWRADRSSRWRWRAQAGERSGERHAGPGAGRRATST